MIVLMAGEGGTDLGVSRSAADVASGENFLIGPLVKMILQLLPDQLQYIAEPGYDFLRLVSKQAITNSIRAEKQERDFRFAARKHSGESVAFFKFAYALGKIAAETLSDIAILFKDSDDNASSTVNDYEDKWNAATEGFLAAGFLHGVPMIPRPISEAWLLCAFQENPYQNCASLEEESRSSRSPSGLKEQLEQVLGQKATREVLLEQYDLRNVNSARIDMPSFNKFKERLNVVFVALGFPASA